MVNGGNYYNINFPPLTTFTYFISPQDHMNMVIDSGNTTKFKASDLLVAIQNGIRVGYDAVARVWNKEGKEITADLSARGAVKSLMDVSRLHMQGFVYAQPSWKESKDGVVTTFRNIYFDAWEARTDAPIMLSRSHLSSYPQRDGRDIAFNKRNIGKAIPMMEFSVTHNYKGNTASILRKSWRRYFDTAVDYIKNNELTSYKCVGISTSESQDSDGKVWTAVTVTIHALRYGYWNPNYGESDAYYVEHK